MTDDLYPERLTFPTTCIGVGGIGSMLVPMLVRAGVRRLILWDDDILEAKNLQMQNFYANDIGKYKAEVLAERALAINPFTAVRVSTRRFVSMDLLDGLVISAVDSMQSRKQIFEAMQRQRENVVLLVDARMTRQGDYLDIYFIDPHSQEEMENYKASLFDDNCALKSPRAECMTAHVPHMLSGLIGEALAVWAQDRSHPWKVTYDAVMHHTERYSVSGTAERSTP